MAPPRTNKESVERAICPCWMDQFEAFERFIKKHDWLPNKDENKGLWMWIRTQRKNIKSRGRVRGFFQEQKQLLESISFLDFESRRDTPRITPIWHGEKLRGLNGDYFRDNAIRSWLNVQRRQCRDGSLQLKKIELLKDVPFDWMPNTSTGENRSTRRSPPSSSSGRISALGTSHQLATKPTMVVEEALVPASADPKPAGGDFTPG
jgi:hypothetical protein